MANILKPNTTQITPVEETNERTLKEITESLLFDSNSNIDKHNSLSVPIAQIATLGSGVSSLIPALNTVTQTATINTSGLYELANAAVGDSLKVAKSGNFCGYLKSSKLAELKPVNQLTSTTKSVAAINPAMAMMAVTLFSIEQKLGEIEKMQKQILSFLEVEKESEIEADVEILSQIANKYKFNWDNEHFLTSNHKLMIDIQRTARKNMNVYQKKVFDILNSKKLIIAQSQISSTLKDLQKNFKYYRLSLYTFSLSSTIEIMLSGNFKEEYITGIKEEIEKLSSTYRDLFAQCSIYLEKISDVSVKVNVLKGIGTTSKSVGKFIGKIPLVKEGQVDEFLQSRGEHIKSNITEIEMNTISEFAKISNPETHIFIKSLEDMIQIYNHTNKICFDNTNIYLIS